MHVSRVCVCMSACVCIYMYICVYICVYIYISVGLCIVKGGCDWNATRSLNHFIVTRHVWHQGYLLSDILYWIQSLTLYINSFRVDPAMNSSNRSSAAFRKIFFFFYYRLAEPVIYTELGLKTVSREGSVPDSVSIPDISPGTKEKEIVGGVPGRVLFVFPRNVV